MPLLNRKVDYALLILCYLHQKETGGCAREIAAQFRLVGLRGHILKDLCQKDYVASHRGVKGGYVLRAAYRWPHRLADLIDALDDTVQLAECNATPPEGCCDLLDQCPIRGPIGDVHRRIREVLESVTLADLFQQSMIDRPLQLDLSRCEKVTRLATERTNAWFADLHGQSRDDAHRPARARCDVALFSANTMATANSVHVFGQRAAAAVDRARDQVAALIGAETEKSSSRAVRPRATTSPSRA